MTDYKLVPVEPTEGMIDAARDQHEGEPYLPVSLYKAMLAAAPDVQKPAPDVAGLVEALTELCDEIDKHEINVHAAISKTSISWFKRKARKALAAHRSQGGGQ